MRFILTCLVLSFLFGGRTDAQVMNNGGETYVINSHSATDWASLLFDKSVREDLELLDDQQVELDKLIKTTSLANNKAQELFSKTINKAKTPEERQQALKDYQAAKDQIRMDFEVKSRKHLLPHQIVRLKRAIVVLHLENLGIDKFLSTQTPLGTALQLSAEDRKKIKAKASEVGIKLKKEIAAIRKEIADLKIKAAKEILSELPSEKQKIVRDQFGLEF